MPHHPPSSATSKTSCKLIEVIFQAPQIASQAAHLLEASRIFFLNFRFFGSFNHSLSLRNEVSFILQSGSIWGKASCYPAIPCYSAIVGGFNPSKFSIPNVSVCTMFSHDISESHQGSAKDTRRLPCLACCPALFGT